MKHIEYEELRDFEVQPVFWKSAGYFLPSYTRRGILPKNGLVCVGCRNKSEDTHLSYFGATLKGDVYISEIRFFQSNKEVEKQIFELSKKIGAYKALEFMEL